MRVIKTLGDIGLLRAAGTIEPQLLDEAAGMLAEIHGGLEEAASLEEFSLKDHGPIVILESGDNLRDLEEIGLNACDDGLLGAVPEWASLLELPGGLRAFSATIALSNSFCLSILMREDALDDQARAWMERAAGIS